VRCPGDVFDPIGGLQMAGVGQGQGSGKSFVSGVLGIWLNKVTTGQSGLPPYHAR